MERKRSINAPVTLFLHSIHAPTIIFAWLQKILFINVCIYILRLFILQSIRGVQFEITAIQIFREQSFP